MSILMNSLFFELIRVAIGTQDRLTQQPSNKEWSGLYDLAKKHSLVGVCFVGLQRLSANADEGLSGIGISEVLYLTWMGMAAKIQQKNEVVNQQCTELQAKLSTNGFRSCILKGQGVAILYGEHLHSLRQSGDIDIWLDGEMDDIIRYVNSISPFEKINLQHLDLRVFKGTEVEVHFTPSRWTNRLRNRFLQTWFGEVRDAQMTHKQKLPNGAEIVVPTTEFNLVYLLLHIYRHFFGEGVGLRQLMDYHFALKSASLNEASYNEVKSVVASLGLEKFASAVMWVLQSTFGSDTSVMPWTPNQRDGEFLLSEVMQMGNFGHSDERFRIVKEESHLKHFWQSSHSKWRFLEHFPSEIIWQPIDMFLRFFEQRALRRRALRLK